MDRRRAMQLGLAACWMPFEQRMARAEPAVKRRSLVAIGGGCLSSIDSDRRLLRYVLSLSSRREPSVLCLPTASGDNLERLVAWYEIMHGLDCRPRHLRLFGPTNLLQNFERQIAEADVIFVPGGNTLNLLQVWRGQELDRALRAAWERGTVIAGESAGMICWFEQGVTDSRPERLGELAGLGWLAGSACPHYNNPQRRPAFHELMKRGAIGDGLACDDGAALVFDGSRLAKVVTISPTAHAYRVRRTGAQVLEERLSAELLPAVK